jgi:hypothetical protein
LNPGVPRKSGRPGCNDNPADFFHGNYDVEHNAFAYLADFPTQCQHLSNFGPLLSNLSSSRPADFNWVIPDLDNAGGDNGTMSSGDTWLAAGLPKIMNTPWYRHGGQIVISYDTGYEDGQGYNGSDGGRIPCVVISAHTKGMGLVTLPHNTAGLLRSVEHVYGLPYLGDATDPDNGSLGDALVPGRPAGRLRPGWRQPPSGPPSSHNPSRQPSFPTNHSVRTCTPTAHAWTAVPRTGQPTDWPVPRHLFSPERAKAATPQAARRAVRHDVVRLRADEAEVPLPPGSTLKRLLETLGGCGFLPFAGDGDAVA